MPHHQSCLGGRKAYNKLATFLGRGEGEIWTALPRLLLGSRVLKMRRWLVLGRRPKARPSKPAYLYMYLSPYFVSLFYFTVRCTPICTNLPQIVLHRPIDEYENM